MVDLIYFLVYKLPSIEQCVNSITPTNPIINKLNEINLKKKHVCYIKHTCNPID